MSIHPGGKEIQDSMNQNPNQNPNNPAQNVPSGRERNRKEPVTPEDERAIREKNLDKTIADSFPTSDPPSTIPDPSEDEDAA